MKPISEDSRSLAKVLESRYWKEEDARALLDVWARSGESVSVFARRHGLAPHRLLRWKQRLSGSERQPVFHPVKVIAADGAHRTDVESGSTVALELIVGPRRRIVVRRGFDPEVLAELVRTVESWEC